MDKASPACLRLDKQLVARAFSRAWAKTGKRMAARMAIMAITTSSSISVKARTVRVLMILSPPPLIPTWSGAHRLPLELLGADSWVQLRVPVVLGVEVGIQHVTLQPSI